jgi:hypothetical protein
MPRLVAFGCSHTYGFELPDCPTISHPPSKMGFPNIVGKQLNLEVVNRSDTGASQKQIAATILNTQIMHDDIVLINWTYPMRRGIWNGNHWEQLATWTDDKTWKKFYTKYHRREDDVLDSLMNINLANMFLDRKCKKVINSLHEFNREIVESSETWNNVKIDLVFVDNNYYYETMPKGHPDLTSHEVYAQRLLDLL